MKINRSYASAILFSALAAFIAAGPKQVISQVVNPGVQYVGSPPANNDCIKASVVGGNLAGITTAGGACAASVTPQNATQTNDTNVTLTLSGTPTGALLQPIDFTVGWQNTLGILRGGTGSGTQQGAINNLMPTPTRAGDGVYWNGSNWTNFPGNNSGTQVYSENSSGVPGWISNAMTFAGQSVALGASATMQGTGAKIQASTGTAIAGNCVKFDANGNTVDNGAACGGATGANPSTTAGPNANNGAATTFMRSDATPAVQLGNGSQQGLIEIDNSTLTQASNITKCTTATTSQIGCINLGAVLATQTPGNPTGSTSTVGVMMGLGSTCKITPGSTGRVELNLFGIFGNPVSTATLKFYYADNAVTTTPANQAAITGTNVGNPIAENVAVSDIPFNFTIVITGLTTSHLYWFDVSLATTNAANTSAALDISCSGHEF